MEDRVSHEALNYEHDTEYVVEAGAARYRQAGKLGRLIMRLRKDEAYWFHQFLQAQDSVPAARRAAANDPDNYLPLGTAS